MNFSMRMWISIKARILKELDSRYQQSKSKLVQFSHLRWILHVRQRTFGIVTDVWIFFSGCRPVFCKMGSTKLANLKSMRKGRSSCTHILVVYRTDSQRFALSNREFRILDQKYVFFSGINASAYSGKASTYSRI